MSNPFRPGAGHQPPYLAGRTEEKRIFDNLLDQEVILQNLILSGLRGIGKTVLLESFKPLAIKKNWLWINNDFSESTSITEQVMAVRLLTDVALITSGIRINSKQKQQAGFHSEPESEDTYLNYKYLVELYEATPGLVSDKLKRTLLFVWDVVQQLGIRGLVFAYDEAQTLSDQAQDKEYPFSILLDVFQSLQKQGVRFMLVLTGLPTLLTKLVETRTYSERLFKVVILDRLSPEESKDAIIKPIEDAKHPVRFDSGSVQLIIKQSDGYPFFIQFICREVYDVFEQNISGGKPPFVPIDTIIKKLDNDFFAGRWSRATDRERELLMIIAQANLTEFGVQQVVDLSHKADIKAFSPSQINQMFNRLIDTGLVYKNRRGSYAFAVPLLEKYIVRTS